MLAEISQACESGAARKEWARGGCAAQRRRRFGCHGEGGARGGGLRGVGPRQLGRGRGVWLRSQAQRSLEGFQLKVGEGRAPVFRKVDIIITSHTAKGKQGVAGEGISMGTGCWRWSVGGSAAQAQPQEECGLAPDAAVGQRAVVGELDAATDQTLEGRRDALPDQHLQLDGLDRVGRRHVQREGAAGEGLDEDLQSF